jgi:hypothetical protein
MTTVTVMVGEKVTVKHGVPECNNSHLMGLDGQCQVGSQSLQAHLECARAPSTSELGTRKTHTFPPMQD